LYSIEDVRTFAGQTVTVSFWAKSATSNALNSISFNQNFGSGGSATVGISITPGFTLTSSWVRYSRTVTVPSISGKTIGAGSNLRLTFDLENSTAFDFDLWGVQVEQGSTATAFQTATGTIQGELAACQRYYWRNSNSGAAFCAYGVGFAQSTTVAVGMISFPVPMRIAPTTVEFSNLAFENFAATQYAYTGITINAATTTPMSCKITGAVTGATGGQVGSISANNSTSGYLAISAEL